MRGKVTERISSVTSCGITPAYAGKSQWDFRLIMPVRDHPRLCGEKAYLPTHSYTLPGSPPPMRGKGFQSCKGQFLIGITPAYAGKRHNTVCWQLLIEDHPRLCGEKGLVDCAAVVIVGSPPPMRGKAGDMRVPVLLGRITPAYAGKSLQSYLYTS